MVPDWTGSDGAGLCVGCGRPVEEFTEDCPVCVFALNTVMGWVNTGEIEIQWEDDLSEGK